MKFSELQSDAFYMLARERDGKMEIAFVPPALTRKQLWLNAENGDVMGTRADRQWLKSQGWQAMRVIAEKLP
jgi:hypothetical protein